MQRKQKILCIKQKDSAVFKYRFDRPLIEEMGAKYQRTLLRKNDKLTLDELGKRYRKKCDVLVIKYIDNAHTLDVIYTMRNKGNFKVVLDIDDNIWQIPMGNIARGNVTEFTNRATMLAESVKCADWVTVSTSPLKEILTPLNDNVVVLPNYINPKEWKFKRKAHKKVRIGWVWSPTHIPDNQEVEGALKEINEKYGNKIEIVIFGTTKNIFDFDTVNIPAVKFDKYPQIFREAGIDISVGPLANNQFNRCKSNIKWLESTMAGAVFIGSKVYPYASSVNHCKTGYIADSQKQWVKYLSWMIDNEEKRKGILKNAEKEVLANYADSVKWDNFYKCL